MFEINGKIYTERPQQPKKKTRIGRIELMAMAMTYINPYNYGSSNYTRPFPKLKNSLVEEFRLIQEKKSSLSRAERKMIESRFHTVYQEVQDEN